MVVQFRNAYLELIFQGKVITGKPRYSTDVIIKFKKTILKLQYAGSLRELKTQRGLNFERLKGNYKGKYSVRVDQSYRLLLTLDKNPAPHGTDILTVHDLTNHYQ